MMEICNMNIKKYHKKHLCGDGIPHYIDFSDYNISLHT